MSTCGTFIIFIVPMWSHILDIILPMNESRSRFTIHVLTEYFVDQEKYFYLILLHMNAAICIGMITVVGTGTTLLTILAHVCGMFTIVR